MEQQYLSLLWEILNHGQRESNRTGIDTLTLPGAMLKGDLRDGFPAVTTKELAWGPVVGELIAFLRGATNVADFQALGCNIWNQNAYADKWKASPHHSGEPGDMGRIYGAQWRDWRGFYPAMTDNIGEVDRVDQIAVALDQLRNNPESRRIIVNAWNAAELDQAALPPCHVLFQLLPRSDGTLHMTMYQRSCDMFLGVPFNMASYALLLELFAAWSGRQAATLTMFLADAHIYVNHIDQVKEQLNRSMLPAPKLDIFDALPDGCRAQLPLEDLLAALHPAAIRLEGYQSHPALRAPMAV
jgi:thymidylate synthase